MSKYFKCTYTHTYVCMYNTQAYLNEIGELILILYEYVFILYYVYMYTSIS